MGGAPAAPAAGSGELWAEYPGGGGGGCEEGGQG